MTVPTPGPFAVVRMGRSNAAGFILLAIFLGVIVGVAAISSANSDDSSERAIGFGIAGLFALPLILLIILAPRFLAPASVVLDPYGLRLRMGGREHIIAWPLIAGIGIGYAYQQQPGHQPLSLSMDAAKDYLVDKASGAMLETLHLSDKRQFALEIYPIRPDAVAMVPGLQRLWVQQPPAAPSLPPFGWRIPLPPVTPIADQLGRATFGMAPQRWVGFVARPWRGKA